MGMRCLFAAVAVVCTGLVVTGGLSPVPGHFVFLDPGQAAKLECGLSNRGVKGSDDVAWFVEKPGIEPRHTSGTSYSIPSASQSDTGNFTCFSKKHSEWSNVTVQVFVSETVSTTTYNVLENSTISLKCPLGEGETSTWSVNGREDGFLEEARHTDSLSRTRVVQTEANSDGTLVIRNAAAVDAGVILCKTSAATPKYYIFKVEGPAFVKTRHQTSVNVLQGDKVTLTCDVFGYPVPEVTWTKTNGSVDATDERVELLTHGGVRDAALRIIELEYADRDEYMCVAANELGSSNFTVLVRVKDKLAALWPFLGIVAEVAILVTIIFLYEKRRSKQDAEEEDAATQEQKHPLTAAETADVRQRASAAAAVKA